MSEEAVCQNPRCARPYTKRHVQQRYCSRKCRIQAQNSRMSRGKICRWCGERLKLTRETMSRSYCYKKECVQRQWLWTLLRRYDRCKQCHSVTPRGRNEWGSINYCPFCIGSTRREVRERYVKWLRNLPRYVTALLPNPVIKQKNLMKYVKLYDINNVEFQVFYPYKEEERK